MSSNRLMYDTCAYAKRIEESVDPLAYVLNPMKYENCQKCRHELGLVGGTAVSHIKGNLVDLENDLRGATRLNSLCPAKKYKPSTNNTISFNGSSNGKLRTIDTSMQHLPSCQMIRYRPTPMPPAMNLNSCPTPQLKSANACQSAPRHPNCN